jgi:UDP-N-acetylmuramate dehydrogenase
MMAAATYGAHLIDRLPKVRGRLTADAPLAQVTWFRVGGPAEVMFRPADVDDLSAFLAAKPADVPVTVLGVASNLLVRDRGIKGVVVRLGRGFVEIEANGDTITAGAGALDFNVALTARDAGIAGLEFLSGIPGTVGGGLRMNAGAYGSEFKDVLESATALDATGARHDLAVARGLDFRRRAFFRKSRRQACDRAPHGRDPGSARAKPADPGQDRRLDLRQSARPQGVAARR